AGGQKLPHRPGPSGGTGRGRGRTGRRPAYFSCPAATSGGPVSALYKQHLRELWPRTCSVRNASAEEPLARLIETAYHKCTKDTKKHHDLPNCQPRVKVI